MVLADVTLEHLREDLDLILLNLEQMLPLLDPKLVELLAGLCFGVPVAKYTLADVSASTSVPVSRTNPLLASF